MKKMTVRKMLENIVVKTAGLDVKKFYLVSTDGEVATADFAIDLIWNLAEVSSMNLLWEVEVVAREARWRLRHRDLQSRHRADQRGPRQKPLVTPPKEKKEGENVARQFKTIEFDDRKTIASMYANGAIAGEIAQKIGVSRTIRLYRVEARPGRRHPGQELPPGV